MADWLTEISSGYWRGPTAGVLTIAVYVRGEHECSGTLDEKLRAGLVGLFPRHGGDEYDFATVRAWGEVVESPREPCQRRKGTTEIPCDECRGRGRVTGRCNCCDHECSTECEDCDGSGKVPCCSDGFGPVKPYFIRHGRAVLNARLLWTALGHVTAETVRVASGGDLDPVTFVADDWRIVCMPHRIGVDDTVHRELPAPSGAARGG